MEESLSVVQGGNGPVVTAVSSAGRGKVLRREVCENRRLRSTAKTFVGGRYFRKGARSGRKKQYRGPWGSRHQARGGWSAGSAVG